MSPEWFGILLLGVLFVAIFIGFPIAFTLIAVAAIGGYAMLGPLALHLMTLQVFSVMRDPTLASVPFFLFMGFLLEQSGLMERLFRGVQLTFASLRGSLYLAVLVTATIFAAATGIVGSSVTLLGVMAAPAMKRSGYDIRLSAGAIAAVPSYLALIWRAKTNLDDSLDVVAAHGLGGTVGALLTGVFAQKALNGVADGLLFGNPGQLFTQAVAVAAAIVYSGALTFVLLKVVALVFPLRASQDDEQVGMDLIAHGEEAYVHASGSGV